jgi:hypothetical protein
VCSESQSTSRDPNRTRLLTVQVVIRDKMQCDKKSLLVTADASKKRNLMVVGGHPDNTVDLCGEDSTDVNHQCLDKGQTMLTNPPKQTEFQECWSESIIKNGLSPSLVDDPLFRKVLVTTTDRRFYNLLLKLDEYYSNHIKGLDEVMQKKMHNFFMNRWSVFHVPIHSAAVTMDKQFCRREMDERIRKDIWSMMEDFSKAPGGKDFSKMKAQYTMFVDVVVSKQVYEVKDDVHGVFTPEMMKLPQVTWIETFVEGVTDKSTGLSIFKEIVWFVYKVSGVMYSTSVFEHCWSIEGWIHSKRRNKFHQKLVEKLVHTHTNLVL